MKADENNAVLPPDVGRVLLVMLDHHLGNFCVCTHTIAAFLSYFDPTPDLLVTDLHAGLASLLEPRARVLSARRGRGVLGNLDYVRLLTRLPLSRYRAVIDLGSSIRSAGLTAATFAPVRIGESRSERKRVYTRHLSAAFTRELDRYSRALELIGHEGPLAPIKLRAPAEAKALIETRLSRLDGWDGRPLVVMHPGSTKLYRIWPAERFTQVADAVVERHDARVCIIGAPGERELMDEVRSAMRRPAAACCLSLPLVELLALYERSAVLVCNEGGPGHLATLTDLPLVAIFGPAREERWGPWPETDLTILRGAPCDPRCGKRVCYADSRCLLRTTVEDVVAAAEALSGTLAGGG